MKILSIVKESYKQEITVTYINHISLIFEYTKDVYFLLYNILLFFLLFIEYISFLFGINTEFYT